MVKKLLNPMVAATIIMILYIIMPVMTVLISKFITTYAYMLMCVALFSFIMLAGGANRFSELFGVLAPLIVFIICTFFCTRDTLVIWGYRSLLLLLVVAAGYYYMYYRDDAIPVFSKFIIFAVVVTAITTIIGVIRFPEASRILATIETSDSEDNLIFNWNNIGGYEFVYTCVLLYPVLILAYKMRKIGRVTFLALFFFLVMLVIFAEYTIALILVMITSLLYFAGKKTNAGQLLIIGIVLFALLFLFQSTVNSFLVWLSDNLGSDIISERLTSISGGVSGIESSESNRLELYELSFNAFLKSPAFGNMFYKGAVSGGHSFILDSLADYGLLGGITLVVLYRNIYRFFFKPFKREDGYGFVLWAFVQTVILSSVNTEPWLAVLTFFMPAIISEIYERRREEDIYEYYMDS